MTPESPLNTKPQVILESQGRFDSNVGTRLCGSLSFSDVWGSWKFTQLQKAELKDCLDVYCNSKKQKVYIIYSSWAILVLNIYILLLLLLLLLLLYSSWVHTFFSRYHALLFFFPLLPRWDSIAGLEQAKSLLEEVGVFSLSELLNCGSPGPPKCKWKLEKNKTTRVICCLLFFWNKLEWELTDFVFFLGGNW